MKKGWIVLWIIMIPFLIGGCSNKEADIETTYAYTFRLAESHPNDHPATLADYEFARLVQLKSNGRIKILVYDNKALGEERDVIEQLQFGGIDFARVSTGPLTEFVPSLNVIQLPYLYEDGDHMWQVLQSDIGDDFLLEVGEAGFIGLGWMDAGARSFYNQIKPIKSKEDLVGMKFRVMQSEMMTEMVEVLGASAIAMPFGEVYGALQTGIIDGAENNWASYDTSSHYEVAGFYSVDEHVRVPEMLLGSEKALSVLSEEDRLMILEAAGETEVYQRKLWLENEKASRNKMLKLGVQVNVIDDRQAFREAMIPLYEVYAEGYMDVVERIQEGVE